MSEAPARKPDAAAGRRSDEASPRRHDPDVALTAEARPAPRPGPSAGRGAAPRAPRIARAAAAPARPASAGPLDRLRVRVDRLMRHPAGIVGGLLALGAVAAVAANALSFQTGRHPAPLFAKAPTGKAPAGKAQADKAPQDKDPADRTSADKSVSPAELPAQASARADASRAVRPEATRDGIGALLRGDDRTTASLGARSGPAKAAAAKPAPAREAAAHPPAREAKVAEKAEPKVTALHASAPAAGAKPDKSIAYAQRALVKLGYGPLTVDGIAGPSTRAALARFERERRLPGASVARRTMQELEARSGLKPE